MSHMHRREFIKKTSATGLGVLATSSGLAPFIGERRSPIETVRVAVVGVNGRGAALARHFATLANSEVAYVCDVDSAVLQKGMDAAKAQTRAPRTSADFRRILDDKSVDALCMATPDHWHAPMTLLALQAGKHVYLEKPSGHNPREDELLMEAARKYQRLHVQLGTQRRSAPHFFEALQALKDGVIGKTYLARAWYANSRTGIGRGKVVPVPANLDYELWQGPAPRAPYRDNVIHYNWHWFTRWGTGEICNNGTHELDVARWLLALDYPTSVSSVGGRFHGDDDWEFTDTQTTTFTFEGDKVVEWHGQSCNGLPTFGRGRGTMILGTAGSMIIDQDGYIVSDLKNKIVKDATTRPTDALNTTGDGPLTEFHIKNFLDAIRVGTKLNAPIEDGAKTGLLCHLGTIAQQTGRKLRIDPKTGHILGDADAMSRWTRAYEPGWAPTV